MNWYQRIAFLLSITRTRGIARRYIVVNGFDGALTMLGLLMGFQAGGGVTPGIAVSACLGAALALAVSGISSAYLSEVAERHKALRELENAMVEPLRNSAHAEAARVVPFLVGLANGLSPLLVSCTIMVPLWLAAAGVVLPHDPLVLAIAVAFVAIFVLGAFLGKIGSVFWLWSGLRAVLIAVLTCALILALR
jgi:predicted membrane protein (TIGR00267 family)